MKVRPMGSNLLNDDRQTDMTKLAFRNALCAPKMAKLRQMFLENSSY
jgi:hypothetical protein